MCEIGGVGGVCVCVGVWVGWGWDSAQINDYE